MAMNFWATIEHSLQYKYKGEMPLHVAERLSNAADAIIALDREMSSVRNEIMDAQNSSQTQSNLVKDIYSALKTCTRFPTKEKLKKSRMNFYGVFRTKDLQQLARFHRQLDIIAEGYRAQSVFILGVYNAKLFYPNKAGNAAARMGSGRFCIYHRRCLCRSSFFRFCIISRLLESRGYRVGIIPQPDWRHKESIQTFGEPRLGFLVTAGNMDSMVNHYTVSRKHRQKDSYSPGGEMGLRPDMPTVVYSNLIRQTYKHTPIILGGN